MAFLLSIPGINLILALNIMRHGFSTREDFLNRFLFLSFFIFLFFSLLIEF